MRSMEADDHMGGASQMAKYTPVRATTPHIASHADYHATALSIPFNRTHHADDHLCNLKECDERGKGGDEAVEPGGGEEEVHVHDRVDTVVHRGEPDPRGDACVEGVPAVHEDGCVVEPVEERDVLLVAQDHEDRVEQLGDLRVDEHRLLRKGRVYEGECGVSECGW